MKAGRTLPELATELQRQAAAKRDSVADTRAAHDVESYDRSIELETIGGRVLELTSAEWRQVANPN